MATLIERRKLMQEISGAAPPFEIIQRLIVPQGVYVDSGLRADDLLNLTIQGLVTTGGAVNGFGSLTTIHGTQRYHKDNPGSLRIGTGNFSISDFFVQQQNTISIVKPSIGYYSINGVEGSFAASAFDCYINMILFARGREGSAQMEYGSYYLYGHIYMERNGVERDFYPAICTEAVENVRGVVVPAGTPGLWNKIDNTFWTSDSETAFSKD